MAMWESLATRWVRSETILATEGAYNAETEKQCQALKQKIQDVHQQYERAKSMGQRPRQRYVDIISKPGLFGERGLQRWHGLTLDKVLH